MKQLLLTGLLLSFFIGLPGAVYSNSESVAPVRYFVEGRVVAVTRNTADVDGEVIVLFMAGDRRRTEQVASIRKNFCTARRVVVQIRDKDERYEANVLRCPDQKLNVSLRLKNVHRQFDRGETLKLAVFLYGT